MLRPGDDARDSSQSAAEENDQQAQDICRWHRGTTPTFIIGPQSPSRKRSFDNDFGSTVQYVNGTITSVVHGFHPIRLPSTTTKDSTRVY